MLKKGADWLDPGLVNSNLALWEDQMNGRQKVVLAVGFLLIFAAGTYPPWTQSWSFFAGGEDAQFRIASGSERYSCLFSPPAVPAWVESTFPRPDDPNIKDGTIDGVSESAMRAVVRSLRSPGHWRTRVDTARLLVEWAIILAGVGVGLLLFASEKPTASGTALR